MQDQGPFDRILQPEPTQPRDRTATVIVVVGIVLGLVLLVLVLPPIAIFDDDGPAAPNGPVTGTIRDEFPPPPAGFEAVSALFDLVSEDSLLLPAAITVTLSTQVSQGEQLSLFTYRDDGWQRLGAATVLANGQAAQGQVPIVPDNVAVLRAVAREGVVLGSLPAGAALDTRALAVLTTLNPAGFAPSSDGGVSGDLLALPSGLEIAVAPTISASTATQAQTLNSILASPELRSAHVVAILEFARDNNFAGVDLDYQTIDPAREDDFVSFVDDLAAGLRAEGRGLSLTLPLPVREGGGWDTLGVDWPELVPLVDAIKLAPEPEQDQYYQRTEEALGYLVSRVGSGKLLLTLSPVSHERGVDGVRALTLTEALSIASVPAALTEATVAPGARVQAMGQNLVGDGGVGGLHWDDVARTVAFTYTGAGGARTVWLANQFSEAFKLDLARRYQLGGVAVEDVSLDYDDANIWPALVSYAQTGEAELVKPNGELLQPRWTASAGVLEGEEGPLVTWLAPDDAGTYTLTLIVSDGVMRVGQQLLVPVQAPQTAAQP